MRFSFVIIFLLLSAPANACMVGEKWFDQTRAEFDKLDANKNGKLEKDEFLARKKKSQKSLENEWNSEIAAKKGYLTKDEYVNHLRPRCIEVKK